MDGNLYSNGWNTICWYRSNGRGNQPKGTICDPNINTGPLLRCPSVPAGAINPCSSSNDDWPTIVDVNNAINMPNYDTYPFDKYATAGSFRNILWKALIVALTRMSVKKIHYASVMLEGMTVTDSMQLNLF